MHTAATAPRVAFDQKAADRVAASTAGHWATKARKLDSDLPGVSYLQVKVATDHGAAIVQVYSARRAWGCASVVLGGVGQIITPTQEMADAFTAAGCVDIFG